MWNNSTLIFIMCLGYILNYFIESELFMIFLSYLTMIVLIICILKARKVSKYMGISLTVIGLVLNYFNDNIAFYNLQGVLKNLPLLTLLLFVPLISIPLKSSGLIRSAYYYINAWKKDERKTFFVMTVFLALLSPILNLGSVRMLHDVVEDVKLNPKLQAKAYFVGFSTAMVWSPYFGSIALILYYTGLQVSNYIFIGLAYSLLLLLAGNLLYKKNAIAQIDEPVEEDKIFPASESSIHAKNTIKLLIILGTLIITLLVLESITGISMLLLVSLIAMLFPVVWGFLTKKLKLILSEVVVYQQNAQRVMNDEIVLFLSAGVFGDALAQSELSNGIKNLLISISEISFFLIIVGVTLIVVVLACIGVHQIVSVPIIAMQISPELIGTSPHILAFLLIMAWSISSILSPFNAINILVSNITKQSGLTVGVKWNGVYAICIFLIGNVFIYTLNIFL
jgi:hypothetical protein